AILTVFSDIFVSIKNFISDELGDRTHSLFEESKLGLSIEYKQILAGYHPDNHKIANLQSISGAIGQMEFIEEPKMILICGFTEYCMLVLKNVGEILGSQPLMTILEGIEKVLEYVKKYQAGSKEKSKIVNDMKAMIDNIQSEFKTGKKSKGGILKLFSK
ncbi:MAG: hypothetical protein KJ760_09360, partial [Proteobacteria bacterium]|nr:hypothetical protein [Pseudomonadota bacterium]